MNTKMCSALFSALVLMALSLAQVVPPVAWPNCAVDNFGDLCNLTTTRSGCYACCSTTGCFGDQDTACRRACEAAFP